MRKYFNGVGPLHAGLVSAISLSLIASGCAKPPGTSDLQQYAKDINEANRKTTASGGTLPEIPNDVSTDAKEKLAAAQKAVTDAHKAARDRFEKGPNANDPLIKEAKACIELAVPENDKSQAALDAFQAKIDKCKEVEKKLEKNPAFGDDAKALQDFLKAVMVAAAIVAIVYGNYPLASFLLNQALSQKGGKGSGDDSGESGTGSSNKPSTVSSNKANDTKLPPPIDGFTNLPGNDEEGYSVNYSADKRQFILQPMTGMALYLNIDPSDFTKYMDRKDISVCKIGISVGTVGSVKLSLSGQDPCPNISITSALGKSTSRVDSLSAPSAE